MGFKNRLPNLQQISAVYGIVTFIVSGWTLIQFFWRFPSWENFFTAEDILPVLAYSMAINLLESLTIIFTLVSLSVILPHNWLKDVFVSRASIMVILGLGYTIYLSRYLTNALGYYYPAYLVKLTPVIAALIFIFAFLLDQITLLRKRIEDIADRASIFTYIYLPLGLVSLLIVIIRNIK